MSSFLKFQTKRWNTEKNPVFERNPSNKNRFNGIFRGDFKLSFARFYVEFNAIIRKLHQFQSLFFTKVRENDNVQVFIQFSKAINSFFFSVYNIYNTKVMQIYYFSRTRVHYQYFHQQFAYIDKKFEFHENMHLTNLFW